MNKLSVVFLIIGVLLCTGPIAGRIYSDYQEDRMLNEWLNSTEAELDDGGIYAPDDIYDQLREAFAPEAYNGLTANNYTAKEADSVTSDLGLIENSGDNGTDQLSSDNSKSSTDTSDQKVLGIIQIKKINVKEPIVEGVDKSNLRAGIGHVPGSAALGMPGNCVLAGHRNHSFKKFFRRLDELGPGDAIIISTKKEDLEYTVTGSKVVTPDDVSILAGKKDENIITLITCTPLYVASHRLIVTAELTQRTPREP